MQAVLLSSDLMLVSAAQGAADRHGVVLVVAGGAEQAIESCSAAMTRLVVIDLRLAGLEVGDFVRWVRGAKPPLGRIFDPEAQTRRELGAERQAVVVACGPHVHTQSLAAAAAAGCDEVITRGEFDRRIDGLLAEITALESAEP